MKYYECEKIFKIGLDQDKFMLSSVRYMLAFMDFKGFLYFYKNKELKCMSLFHCYMHVSIFIVNIKIHIISYK